MKNKKQEFSTGQTDGINQSSEKGILSSPKQVVKVLQKESKNKCFFEEGKTGITIHLKLTETIKNKVIFLTEDLGYSKTSLLRMLINEKYDQRIAKKHLENQALGNNKTEEQI